MFKNWSGVNNSEPLLWAIKSGIEMISIRKQGRTLDVIGVSIWKPTNKMIWFLIMMGDRMLNSR